MILFSIRKEVLRKAYLDARETANNRVYLYYLSQQFGNLPDYHTRYPAMLYELLITMDYTPKQRLF